MNTFTKLMTAEISRFLGQTSYFWPISLFSDCHINFQKSLNRLNDCKGQEYINYNIVKYEKMFYNHHMAIKPVQVNTVKPG